MAYLLREAIDSGAPPSMARSPMTPEEVAAAYDAEDDDSGCDDCEDGRDGKDVAPEGGARPQDG
jgi:hypothetical protein